MRLWFTEWSKNQFLDETFVHIALFFEGSLDELEAPNAEVETAFKRFDAVRFAASIYRDGRRVSSSTMFQSGDSIRC